MPGETGSTPENPEDSEAPPRLRPIDFLTQRELQIAALVMQGRLNKQIAHHLHIAPNTVQSHLKRIYCKLGVNSRAALVAHLAGCFRPNAGGQLPPQS
jgi:DNA-binding NarL/FixJ family response regulator